MGLQRENPPARKAPPAYAPDRSAVLRLLNEALATEIVRRRHLLQRRSGNLSSLSRRTRTERRASPRPQRGERIAVESYRDLIQYLGDEDPATRVMLKEILGLVEKHASQLAFLIEGFPRQR